MSTEIESPARSGRSRSATVAGILRRLNLAALALAACGISTAHADAILNYELVDANGDKTLKKFSMARFFIRIDDPAKPDQYLLFQAGKFFPLFAVDQAKTSYTRMTPEVIPYMSPQARKHHGADKTAAAQTSANRKQLAPKLKPTRKRRKVAGIECRVVHEIADNEPVVEHCMANSARLAVTDREVITMARTFEMARNRGFGWLGVGTADEEFISIYSRDLRDNRVLRLTDASFTPLPANYLRIPREYTQVPADAKNE